MSKINLPSGAKKLKKQSSGAKKNARLRSKKTSNLKRGLNPNTLKGFMLLHYYGEPKSPKVIVKDIYQTRIGAVKASENARLKTNELPSYNSYRVLPLSRANSWYDQASLEIKEHTNNSPKRKAKIASLQRTINHTKKVIKSISKGNTEKDASGKTVSIFLAKKVLFDTIEEIKAEKLKHNKVIPDLSFFKGSLIEIKKHYGIQ